MALPESRGRSRPRNPTSNSDSGDSVGIRIRSRSRSLAKSLSFYTCERARNRTHGPQLRRPIWAFSMVCSSLLNCTMVQQFRTNQGRGAYSAFLSFSPQGPHKIPHSRWTHGRSDGPANGVLIGVATPINSVSVSWKALLTQTFPLASIATP